jgi:hypothetical protein
MDKRLINGNQPEFPYFKAPAPSKSFLRAKADLVIQPNESIALWGMDEPVELLTHFERIRTRPFVIKKNKNKSSVDGTGKAFDGPLWEPQIPEGVIFNYAYCENVLENIHPHTVVMVLQAMREHTNVMFWFRICLDNYEASYWAHTFSRLFPRFSMSKEGNDIIVVAHKEGRWQ